MSIPPMFPVYAVTNFALVILGYEAASSHTIPHWAILAAAFAAGVLAALQWSRTLARAYRREDQTFSMFERPVHVH
jgi:hypothetical protein